MNEEREKLEKMKEVLRKRREKYKSLENELPEDDHRILGPKNDIEYEQMKKSLKESKND